MSGDDSMLASATVYIYSGRPNPRWTLSIDEWQQLTVLINTLPKLSDDLPGRYVFSGGLGYTGFRAHFPIISSYPDVYFVAKKEQTVLSNPGGHVIYDDKQRIVEKWFRENAQQHGISLPTSV